MPKRQVKVQLSVSSIEKAIKEIQASRERTEQLVAELIDKMLMLGENYAISAVGHVDTGETIASIHGYRNGNKGVIVAGGAAIWIEFGTGVTKNKEVHPKAAELGMSKWGTYGKGYGANPNGWWYPGDDGKYHHTLGIQANMFMWRTAQYLREQFPNIAREVFSTND